MLLLRGGSVRSRTLLTVLIISRPSTIRDVRDMPQENATQKGRILLGYLEERSQDEHLDIGEHLTFINSWISGEI